MDGVVWILLVRYFLLIDCNIFPEKFQQEHIPKIIRKFIILTKSSSYFFNYKLRDKIKYVASIFLGCFWLEEAIKTGGMQRSHSCIYMIVPIVFSRESALDYLPFCIWVGFLIMLHLTSSMDLWVQLDLGCLVLVRFLGWVNLLVLS